MEWADIKPEFMATWAQGEHLCVFGPTGVGKSTVTTELIEDRVEERDAFGAIFANKKRDRTLARLVSNGWRRIPAWPPSYEDRTTHRILIWPQYPGVNNPKAIAPKFIHALDGIMNEGNWTVLINEARYWAENLGLRPQLDELFTGARSNGITVIAEAQGPSWIPTAMREELSWGIFFRPQHRERAKDVADITGDRDLWHEFAALRPHEFVLMRLRTDEAYITKLPNPNTRPASQSSAER